MNKKNMDYGMGEGVKAIKGAVNQPKNSEGCAKPIKNAVAMKPAMATLSRIKGAVTGPK